MSGHCLTWIVQNSNPTSQFLCAALLFCGSLMDIPPQSTHPCRQTRIRLNWAGLLACHRLSQCSASPSGHPKPWHDSRPFLSLYCLSRLSISVNYSTSDLSSRVELSRLRIGDLEREREGLIIQRCTVNPFKGIPKLAKGSNKIYLWMATVYQVGLSPSSSSKSLSSCFKHWQVSPGLQLHLGAVCHYPFLTCEIWEGQSQRSQRCEVLCHIGCLFCPRMLLLHMSLAYLPNRPKNWSFKLCQKSGVQVCRIPKPIVTACYS